MMWYTHFVFNILLGVLFLEIFPIENKWIFLLLVLVFGFVPDLDHVKSKIGRGLPVFSHIINFIFGHRKFFHSIFVPIIVLIVLSAFGASFVGLAFFVGFVSHLIGDALTKEGVNFIYPLKFKIAGPIKTGKFIEKVLFVVILVIDVILILGLV